MKKILFWIFSILAIVVGILAIVFMVLSGEELWMVSMGLGIGFMIAEIPIAITLLCLYWSTYAFDFSK
jgi:hypothetical protein